MGNEKRIPIGFHDSLQEREGPEGAGAASLFLALDVSRRLLFVSTLQPAWCCAQNGAAREGWGELLRGGMQWRDPSALVAPRLGHSVHCAWLQTKARIARGKMSAQACESTESSSRSPLFVHPSNTLSFSFPSTAVMLL